MYVGRGAWAFEVRGRHVGAWRARGETVYRIQRSVLRIQDLETSTHDTAGPRIRNRDATHRDETAASSDGEAGQAFTRTRWLCLRRPRPSPPYARALFQTLAGGASGRWRCQAPPCTARRASRTCTSVVAACIACGAVGEACAVKTVLEVPRSVAFSSAET